MGDPGGPVRRMHWTFGALIAAQAMHSIEEYSGRLYEVFPPARFMCGCAACEQMKALVRLVSITLRHSAALS